jgi:hypothetical protein
MASTEPGFAQTNNSHVHISGEICPLCDQSIPADKLVEIQQRERARAERQAEKLRAEFDRDKASEIAKKNAEIESIRLEAANKASAALVESKKREEAVRAEAASEARKSAKFELDKAKAEKRKLEDQFKEQKNLVAKSATEIEKIRQEKIKAVELEQAESKRREAAIKVEAASQAESAVKEKLAQAEKAKEAAEEKAKTLAENSKLEKKLALEQLSSAKKDSELLKKKELDAQRLALEKASMEALQKEQSRAFDDRQKLEAQLANLQRQLKNKTADELGEAAEFDLFDDLKKSFPNDVYNLIDKGVAGADLWQDIMHNGVKCGRIVFDSKNRESWRNEYVSKLKTDQLNADGDHAVLTTRKFPAGKNQLHIQDGVVVSHPARVIAIVSMLREQIIRVHRLNSGNKLRESKTEELYEFINSERCSQLFDNFDTVTENLFELDVTEKKAHESIWRKRGELIKKAQRTIQTQLRREIDLIIIEDEPS